MLHMTVEDVKNMCELRYSREEDTYYAVEKSKLEAAAKNRSLRIPKGYPIPLARVKNWAKYIIQYDPFSWETNRLPMNEYIKAKDRKRKARAYLERKKKRLDKEE